MINLMAIYARIFFLLIPVCICGQPNDPSIFQRSRPRNHLIQQPKGHLLNLFVTQDAQTQIDNVNLTEVLSIIVEFKENPLFIQQINRRQAAAQTSFFAARLRQFANDVLKIHQSQPNHLRTLLTQPEIHREFHKVFFGASLKVPRVALQQIQHLDYVKKIHFDNQVEAYLDESVPLIRADSVWYKYGTQGDSVVVGILDTGIDYRHSALGGGIGLGFKVIGGYDVINKDADPMDDNGHGTYVAGIVAADGDNVKGVAPKAMLMAFKVLNRSGSGLQSDVIAGIERAMDPNDDNNFSDKVDIANMSLGGPGHPDDAVSTAVDNAVKLGITFCIAAGNDPRFRTIGSPGTARLALTVGASDKSDKMADVSSKGPNARIHSIKPEVVAPGINIRSLSLNGTFLNASGTSAAAPHVTGVCALLKALHPEWSPAQLKSALMTSAIDLGAEVMAQGAGRIDALNAARTGVFAFPAHLSFGLDDVSQAEWIVADTVTVVNQSSVQQNFDIMINGLEVGIHLQATPSSFNLARGDTQIVIMTLKVMNTLVPYQAEGSLAYSGMIYINGTRDQLRLPWAFVKAAKITLTFDEPLVGFVLSSDKSVISNSLITMFGVNRIDSYTYEFIAPKARYDLLAMFPGREIKIVIKENLTIDGFKEFTITSQDATHRLELHGVDEKGRPLSSLNNSQKNYLIFFPDSSRLYLWGLYRSTEQLLLSNISERFVIGTGEYQDDLGGERSIRVVQHQPLIGLEQNLSLTNTPSDFVMQHLKFQYPPNAAYREISFSNPFTGIILGDAEFFFNFIADSRIRVQAREWVGKLYHTPDVHVKYRFSTSGAARDSEDFFVSGDWAHTQTFKVKESSIGSVFFDFTPDIYLSPDGGEMSFGGAPIYGVTVHENNRWGESNIAAILSFYGPLQESRSADVYKSQYAVYNDRNDLIAADAWRNFSPMDVAPAQYRLEIINKNYFVEAIRGAAKLITQFDLRHEDPDPARLTSLKLLNAKGMPAGRVENGESTKLIFSAVDFFYIKNINHLEYRSIAADSTKLYFKKYGTNTWQKIALTRVLEDTTLAYLGLAIGYLYTADLSHTTSFDSAAIDLKISVQDQSGNRTEWTLEPAFAVGKFGTIVSVDDRTDDGNSVPLVYKLYPAHPNPFNPSTVIAFDLPRAEKVTLKIYDVLGREVDTLRDEVMKAGRHKIIWNGAHTHHQLLTSGVYIYRIQAGNFKASQKLLLLR
jgi:hypothetical protein